MSLDAEAWALTGAGGKVAGALRAGVAERVGALRLVDRVAVDPVHPREEAVVADLRDEASVDEALRGVAGVLHLGAIADEADFHDLVEVNVTGTFHVVEAARRAGARRVVLASSNRLTGFYDTATRVDPAMAPRPDGLYGVTKVAGEALGRLYADKFGVEVACLRIGSLEEAPRDERHLSTWLSPRDCLAAFLAAMTAPRLGFAAFYAVSRNTRGWWDLEAGRALGFEPQDDAEVHAAAIEQRPGGLAGPQGGAFATPAFTLDRQRA